LKLGITVRADENVKETTALTFPIIKDFCKKWNADFILLDQEPPIYTEDHQPHYRVMELYKLFDQYDRLMSLDADIIINKTCPNIFDEVPEDSIGSIYEDKGTRLENRIKRMKNIQYEFGDIGWKQGYVNDGMMVASIQHKEIFTSVNGKYFLKEGNDDAHLSYQICKMGFKVKELDYRFNHMTLFSEPWNGNANRFDSYIIHYAGRGVFENGVSNFIEQIKKDIKEIYG
jgi:lipopolysaccharide biosynthesis glycosyltransferase